MRNRLLYGPQAPLIAEQLWINPRHVRGVIKGLNRYSGQVVKTWPPRKSLKIKPLEKDPVIKSSIKRFVKGKPWSKTKDYKKKLAKVKSSGYAWDYDCSSNDQLKEKYRRLDRIYDQIKAEGRLKTRQEINPGNFRESDTFLIHIGPAGELYLGGGGSHRFAIALILELELVPCQLGCIHTKALPHLNTFRNKA